MPTPSTLDIVASLFQKGIFDNKAILDEVEAITGKRPPQNSIANYRSLFRRFGNTWREEQRLMNRNWAKTNPEKKYQGSINWARANPARMLLGQAKQRSKRLGVPCSLTEQDVEAMLESQVCAVTGIRLYFDRIDSSESLKNPWAPSLDRIERHLGYVAGNVRVVCWLFNHMRCDYSDEDVLMVARALTEANK